ncbi:unnamed protein product [Nezara viridula]|uniref:Uncharacterized protein n=1 Tax=Nezara viridula TaxID=85310 RepID=A0A9P0E2N4_NEZVI|nr:unnamed protein product [Nezara viridula]
MRVESNTLRAIDKTVTDKNRAEGTYSEWSWLGEDNVLSKKPGAGARFGGGYEIQLIWRDYWKRNITSPDTSGQRINRQQLFYRQTTSLSQYDKKTDSDLVPEGRSVDSDS